MDENQIKDLAETIATMIASGSKTTDTTMLRQSIESLNARLDKLEQALAEPVRPPHVHPSHERFNIAEAIADAVFGKAESEKLCTFEPHNRPCDNCSMCSSRGF
ncbi:MAG: hypothetical protein KA746_05055 [Pyrinomonadaceae bacterium]|nr:hypothetical protein [Pyrinomonadaceae bacterium]MBP6213095.1 hypothetical protein [Pyrinomonadaceae bacterium]